MALSSGTRAYKRMADAVNILFETSDNFVTPLSDKSYLVKRSHFRCLLLIGQVGNVITNRNASRHEFERHLVSYAPVTRIK